MVNAYHDGILDEGVKIDCDLLVLRVDCLLRHG